MPCVLPQQLSFETSCQTRHTADTEQSGAAAKLWPWPEQKADSPVTAASAKPASGAAACKIQHKPAFKTTSPFSWCQAPRTAIRNLAAGFRHALFLLLLISSLTGMTVAANNGSCPVSIEYAASLGQGGDNSEVPVFVGSLGITNNANVSLLPACCLVLYLARPVWKLQLEWL